MARPHPATGRALLALELGRRMVEGLFAPRRAARTVLAMNLGVEHAVQIALLAYVVQSIIAIAMPGVRADALTGEGLPVAYHALNLIAQVLIVGLVGLAIWSVGRLFGGTGTRDQAIVLVAWHALVTTLLTPLFLIGASAAAPDAAPGAGTLLIFAVAVAQYMWVLACYTMELHGFRNPWGVLGAMVAVTVLFSSLLLTLSA